MMPNDVDARVSQAGIAMSGDTALATVVLDYVVAAEQGNVAKFRKMTGRSIVAGLAPPRLSDVDRTDEGCRVKSLDGQIKQVSVMWDCKGRNYRPIVQRTFLVENGRVTHMWNDWGGGGGL